MTSTAITHSRAGSERPRSPGNALGPLSDTWAMIRRNLIHISRAPMQLSDVTIQPLTSPCCLSTFSEAASRSPAAGAT
jgi:hypothetical protein